MAPLPKTCVSFADGEVTIDAATLAPKLGLSIDALKKEMAKGFVTSIVERGVDDDASRTRLNFRYGARIWRVVVDVDGKLIENAVLAGTPLVMNGRFTLLDLMRSKP